MEECDNVFRAKYIFNDYSNSKEDRNLLSPDGEHSGLKEGRRGRPRADAVTTMMMEGSSSPSAIKCRFCQRVFPREKSLQTHVRTHTGKIKFSSAIQPSVFLFMLILFFCFSSFR